MELFELSDEELMLILLEDQIIVKWELLGYNNIVKEYN